MTPEEIKQQVSEAARKAVEHFLDELVEDVVESQGVRTAMSVEVSYWDDQYIYNHFVDRNWTLRDAVDLVEELAFHVETNSDLWDGQDPSEALKIQAAHTFANAAESEFKDKMGDVNVAVTDAVADGYLAFPYPPQPGLPPPPAEGAPFEEWGRYDDLIHRISAGHARLLETWPEVVRERIRRIVYDVTGAGEAPIPPGVKEWRSRP